MTNHSQKIDYWLFFSVIVLIFLGQLFLSILSASLSLIKFGNTNYFLLHQLLYGLLLGLVLGYLAGKKKIDFKPEIQLTAPPVNINVHGMVSYHSGGSSAVNQGTEGIDDFFKQKQYVPSVESFKDKMDAGIVKESMQGGEIRGKEDAKKIDDEIEKLKKFRSDN